MAALHAALQILSPTSFSSIPSAEPQAKEYLRDAFSKAQLIIDSVPPPSVEESIAVARSRSASNVSGLSEMSASSARSDPLDRLHLSFQKDWGKPIKLAAKDNPLGMAVYKMAGKDGRGAWFARRSVHEGMGFKKWKSGLQQEFPESMQIQGGPGEGNIRGIGGERRVERVEVKGVGTVEVYHLSAQFPGPTTPRDFVTLLITSSSALGNFDSSEPSQIDLGPRHFMVISKPCLHPDCPPRDGFIRGQYESVEFIREIPLKLKKSSSTTELKKPRYGRLSSSLNRKSRLSKAKEEPREEEKTNLRPGEVGEDSPRASFETSSSLRGRKRGRTISYAESRGINAKGEAVDAGHDESEDLEEINPVEWIMVTRSDPGGSVPRFLVERGTPAGIVTDASKFLDWALKKDPPDSEDGTDGGKKGVGESKHGEELEAYQTNGHLAGLDGSISQPEPLFPIKESEKPGSFKALEHNPSGGLLASVANVAYASIESYAPQIVLDHLPAHHQASSVAAGTTSGEDVILNDTSASRNNDEIPPVTPSSSELSFASAEEQLEDSASKLSTESLSPSSLAKIAVNLSPQEKELAKLNERKKALDEKLAKTQEKELKDKEDLTSREEERIRKAKEKHAREVEKQEQKYKKEVAKLEAKRVKEAAKEEERRRKAEDKDEKQRLTREKEELKQQLDVVCKERDILREQVGALQKENTALVAKMGKMGEGSDLLRDLRIEANGGSRSRSGSLRKVKVTTPTVERDTAFPQVERVE